MAQTQTKTKYVSSVNIARFLSSLKSKVLNLYATLASPAFTGTPTAPTAAKGTNTQQIATTAFVKTAVDGIDLSGYVNAAEYVKADKKIYLRHGSTNIAFIETSDFVKDGMVNSVSVTTGTGTNAGKKVLKISFNTDAGLSPIEIAVSEIFNPDNYYTKGDADGKFVIKDASGNVTITGSLDVNKNLLVKGTLTVNDEAELKGDATLHRVNVLDDADFKSDAQFDRNVNVTGELSVTGDTELSGDVTAKKNVEVKQDLNVGRFVNSLSAVVKDTIHIRNENIQEDTSASDHGIQFDGNGMRRTRIYRDAEDLHIEADGYVYIDEETHIKGNLVVEGDIEGFEAMTDAEVDALFG